MDQVKPLVVCCPNCGKPVARALRCDAIEVLCARCGAKLQFYVCENAKLSVELVEENIPAKNNSVAPRNVGLGMNR